MINQKQKVPLKVRLYRLKNTGFLTITDKIIKKLKPPKKCEELPGEILFNRIDKIGDALVTVPVLRDLKLNHPSLTIDVLCSDLNYFIFKDLEFINKIHIYNTNNPAKTEWKLKAEKYNAIVDLVGIDRKLIRMLKRCSPYIAGARLFGYSWIYDYYLDTNWVSEYDVIPMSLKIETLLKECFGFKFEKRTTRLPYKDYAGKSAKKDIDILFHLGTSEIRKLDRETEEKLLELIQKYKVLITDGGETERYKYYREKFSGTKNFTFKLYPALEDIHADAYKTHLILCYDGGQAHFLGQFNKCIVMVGTLLLKHWAPYDFSEYVLYKKWDNGVESYLSQGEMKHIALSFPIWCCPCFGIGCNTRPCINNIKPEQVLELIEANIHADN